MKPFYILSLAFSLLISSFHSFAQEKKQEEQAKTEQVKAGFGVTVVQTPARFPGGQEALVDFVKKNMIYPKASQRNGIEGRVYIGCMITKEGKIKDARVLASLNEELDAEAIRIVKMMPDWLPATKGGVAVDEQYILPFDFVLPKGS